MTTGYNIREGSQILAERRARAESDEIMESVRKRAEIVRRGFDPMGLLSERPDGGGEEATGSPLTFCHRPGAGRSLRRCA